MSELNTVVHFSPVRFYFTMMVLNFIFIVHPTNASVEFLQLNPAHNDDKYVPGKASQNFGEQKIIGDLTTLWRHYPVITIVIMTKYNPMIKARLDVT